MSRRAIMLIASGLAVAAALLPFLAITQLSRQWGLEAAEASLLEYARRTVGRADQTLSQAKDALRRLALERQQGCSPAHVARLRQTALDALSVEELNYFRDGVLVCSSWGMAERRIAVRPPDEVTADGFGLVLDDVPAVSWERGQLAVTYGNHQAIVNKERLVDIVVDRPVILGVATQSGKLVTSTGPVDPALLRTLLRGGGSGSDGRWIFASVRSSGLVAFAVTDHSGIDARVEAASWTLLPLWLLVSLVLVALIAWVSRQRLSLKGEFVIALRKGELFAHYQPIIEVKTGRCVGAEALIRWRRPDGSWVSPDLFVPFAEQNKLIAPLTDLMIARVIRDLGTALTANPSMHIAINVSAEDIDSGRFLPVIEEALRGTGVAPGQIWIEATERGFKHQPTVRRTIERAQGAGHQVAIDDFGTGYSSLSLLEGLPLNALKIDKAFIDAIGRDAATSVVTPHIIKMAQALGFAIVAEGVETAQQEAYIRAAGVEYAQGWLYAKALPPDEFLAFFRDRNQSLGRTAGTVAEVAG
jgi:sensor c-di-GMP phosphodiesterase-like protein